MRRILLFAGYFATASAAVRLTDIYGGELHMRHFQSRMVKDAIRGPAPLGRCSTRRA